MRKCFPHGMEIGTLIYVVLLVVIQELQHGQANRWITGNEQCTVPAPHCIRIPLSFNDSCLGNHLPYRHTAPHPIVEDVSRYHLHMWTPLRAIPACWDKLQFFLCSVYFPECMEEQNNWLYQAYSAQVKVVASGNDSTRSSSTSPNADTLGDARNRSAMSSPRVVLPEAEMCEAVHKACPILVPFGSSVDTGEGGVNRDIPLLHPLPRFLDCSLYQRGCRKNKLTSRLFQNNGGDCEAPLITTAVRQNWISGIERCSFPCRRPHFHPEQYHLARWISGVAASVCVLVNLIVLLTLRKQQSVRITSWTKLLAKFKADTQCTTTSSGSVTKLGDLRTVTTPRRAKWTKPGRQLPDSRCFYLPLFYIHLFFLIGCFGWLMPLLPLGIGEMIACRLDGSLRVKEPQFSSGQSLLCIVNFIMIYFSLVAVATWSTVFDYLLLARTRHVLSCVVNPPGSCAHRSTHKTPTPVSSRPSRESISLSRRPSTTKVDERVLLIEDELSCEQHMAQSGSSGDAPEKICSLKKSVMFPSTNRSDHQPVTSQSNSSSSIPSTEDRALNYVRLQTVDQRTQETSADNRKPVHHNQAYQAPAKVESRTLMQSGDPNNVHIPEHSDLTTVGDKMAHCLKTTTTSKPMVFYAMQAAFPFVLSPIRSRQRCTPLPKRSAHRTSFISCSDACPKCVTTEEAYERRYLRNKSPPAACLHLLGFAVPFVLVLISLTVAEIDGDSLPGICVVGRINIWVRFGLVLIPFSLCLCVKYAYSSHLLRRMNELRWRLSKSPYVVDQEFAHRFGRCVCSHGIFLASLTCLWIFSVSVQLYVIINEPTWLDSQRSMVLCRLRYRLLGLDENAAHTACLTSIPSASSTFTSDYSLFKHNHTSVAQLTAAPTANTQRIDSLQYPRAGPILLHLLSYFALNLFFASTCLLDRSVKLCWRSSLRSCFNSVSRRRSSSGVPCQPSINSSEFIEALFSGEMDGFSWWDPGIFNLPLSPLFSTNMALLGDQDLSPQQHAEVKLDQSSTHKKLLQSTIDSLHADTLSSFEVGQEIPAPRFATVPSPAGVPNEQDIIAQLARLISYYESSAPDDPALILFHHLHQQLQSSVHAPDNRSTRSAPFRTDGSQPSASASQTHVRTSTAPSSSLGVVSSSVQGLPSTSTHPDLVASVAAVYEQCQKQLSTLNEATSRRRNRHRRVLSSRALSGGRRGYSRSLSTTGVFFPTSSAVGSQKSGPSSVVSAAGSERTGRVNEESLSLLQAAASVVAAASLRGSLNRKSNRNSQSGFDGSQASSSSMRSALTRIIMPSAAKALGQSEGRCGSTGGQFASSNSRWSVYPDTNAAPEELGSRMSLRSLSCASSSGAESYNSYRLLINQSGASWRELWRTRMLLMDVLRWVEVVAPMMQHQRKSQSLEVSGVGDDATSVASQELLPEQKSAMNWEAAFANLVSTISSTQQPTGTSCQAQNPEAWSASNSYENTVGCPPNPVASLNPMLAAAFAAATAAATLALQQQQQQETQQQNQITPNPGTFAQNTTFSPRFPPNMSPVVNSPPAWFNQSSVDPTRLPQFPVPMAPLYPTITNASCSPGFSAPTPQFPCRSPSVGGFCGAPDLLLDHDRYRVTAFSPSCTPPFVPGVGPSPRAPRFCRSVPSVPYHYPIPVTYAPWQQVPYPSSVCPPLSTQASELPPQVSQTQNIPSPMVIPTTEVLNEPKMHADPRRSKSSPENGSNDSDAFDSEEEVMSDDEAPGVVSPKVSPSVPFVCPVSPGGFVHEYSQYPTLQTAEYCPAAPYPSESFYNPVECLHRSLAESDVANVDDCDVSSVSQSASQVVPRESSPSSAVPTVEDHADFISEPPCSSSPVFAVDDRLRHGNRVSEGLESLN